jgi:hypothetical protein
MDTITHPPNAEQEPPEDPRLPHVPARQQGPVKNEFLAPVRAGVFDPAIIVRKALAALQWRLRGQMEYRAAAETLDLRQAITAIIAHPTEAEAFARACIAYEQLPAEEKARRKEIRGEAARQAYMAMQPATDKQLWKLRALGVVTAPPSKLHASQLIDGRKGGHNG